MGPEDVLKIPGKVGVIAGITVVTDFGTLGAARPR
jgi:hypothetical protein